jgi:hypothetical protein
MTAGQRLLFLTGKEETMGIDESFVQEIVRRVLAVAGPENIILFLVGPLRAG